MGVSQECYEPYWKNPGSNILQKINQLYGYLPHIYKTIQIIGKRHAGYCWRSKNLIISDVLLETPIYWCASIIWPRKAYLQQLRIDTRCRQEDLPGAMDDLDDWRERVSEIRASYVTWWWRWWSFCKMISSISI